MGMSKITLKEFAIEHGKRYFVRAIPLMVALFLLAKNAPILPTGFLLAVIVIYALITMIGSLHFVVMRKTLRQYKLREGGRLSEHNRRWLFSMFWLFALGLVSGILFLLGAPAWSGFEWLLVFFAIPAYFIIFKCVLHRLKKELADSFDKASAMKWAFWITGILLCVLCAVVSALEAPPEDISIYGAFKETELYFDGSPCVLFSELEYATSFFEGLKIYAMHNVPGGRILIAVIIKVALFASVFFGLASQFCFCLLSKDEIVAEFHRLPVVGEERDAKRLSVISYCAIIFVLVIIFCTGFLFANYRVEEFRVSNGYSFTERQANQWKYQLVVSEIRVKRDAVLEDVPDNVKALVDSYELAQSK